MNLSIRSRLTVDRNGQSEAVDVLVRAGVLESNAFCFAFEMAGRSGYRSLDDYLSAVLSEALAHAMDQAGWTTEDTIKAMTPSARF